MGVLPLQYLENQNAESLGLTGYETFTITGIAEGLTPGKILDVTATREDNSSFSFQVLTRIDTPIEVGYYQHRGVLQFVVRQMLKN